MKPHHFYVAFNPLFNEGNTWKTQAHEFHQKLREKKETFPSSHLYWGKIQISEYSESLCVQDFQYVLKGNEELGTETHLYVTDFQHLWIGKVSEVLKEIPDPENTLSFYKDKRVELWFKITDFDLLSNHGEETQRLLSRFHVDNEFYSYKIKEFTPFTSGIRFPMIVQDKTEEQYFHSNDLRILKDNPLIHTSGEGLPLGQVNKSFVIPEESFKRIPKHIRNQVLQAEILILEAQSQDRKDRAKLEQATLTYLKCLEMLLNETIIGFLKREEGHRIFITRDDSGLKFLRSGIDQNPKSVFKLKDCNEYFNLTQIKMLLDTPSFFSHTHLDYVFQHKKKFWEYCRLQLRPTLKNESLVELRNSLCTEKVVKAHDRELLLIRNILLGVGGEGIFNDVIEAYFDLISINPQNAA